MGAYFSLRGSAEWDRTVAETMVPSIWTNIDFTPLSRDQKMLLHRGREISFQFPNAINQGGDRISMSDVVDLSVLVAFEETAGRMYSGLVVHAPHADQPHTYHRAVEEVTLRAPGTAKDLSAKAREAQPRRHPGHDGDDIFSAVSLDTLGAEEPVAVSVNFPYVMFYAVKEGVIAYFCQEYGDCEKIVREVAASYGEMGSNSVSGNQVKSLLYPIGRAPPPVGRVFCDLLSAELKREFKIQCDPEDQAQYTNCVVMCLRMMLGMKMAVRGYDIRSVCESRDDLGLIVGEAAGEAWEQLWRRVRI